MQRPRPLVALLAATLALPLAACERTEDVVRDAETEGVYVTVQDLRYQVQMSRLLNPYDVEDRDYLVGVSGAAQQVANDRDAWYGVFMRVENNTDDSDAPERALTPARRFYIEDTQGTRIEPTSIGSQNIFAYRPRSIEPGQVLPARSSLAAEGPIGGALILFKVPQPMLAHRPIKLHIEPNGEGEEAEINLDV